MLLDEIKAYLRENDTDDETITNINSAIARGKAKLEGLTGTTLDFENEGSAKSLLFNFCRYDYNNAAEYFEENFAGEILRLQIESAVKDFENQS